MFFKIKIIKYKDQEKLSKFLIKNWKKTHFAKQKADSLVILPEI